MEKNILLVYPEIPKTYWSYSYSLPLVGKKATMPPLGLITIAAMLPPNYNLHLIDMNIEPLKNKDLQWADFIFTSSMVIQKDSLEKVIQRANSLKVPVVAGGPYPTQYFDQIKAKVDHFVLGEAETGVLKAIINDIKNNTAKRVYARPTIRKKPGERKIDQQYIKDLKSFFSRETSDIKIIKERPSINSLPIPRFDLLKMNAYVSMALQQSRGCPHSCEFCNESTLYGHKPRLKTGKEMVAELEVLYNLGFRGSIFIVDDNYVGNKKGVKETLPQIINFQKKHNYPFALYTEADITLSTDSELMELMRDAGFDMVFIGLESPDAEVLRSMGKKQNIQINLSEAVKKIQSYGMEVTAGFIVGNDSDPENICDKIFDFCQKEGIITAMVGLLNAVKGSELYERLKKEGRLRGDSGGDNTHKFELNFEPKKTEKQIIDNYKKLLAKLYDLDGKNCFSRIDKLTDRLGPHPKPFGTIGFTEIKACVKSIVKQSLSPYRKSYLRTLKRTLKYNRSHLAKVFHQVIRAEHYIRFTNEALKINKNLYKL